MSPAAKMRQSVLCYTLCNLHDCRKSLLVTARAVAAAAGAVIVIIPVVVVCRVVPTLSTVR